MVCLDNVSNNDTALVELVKIISFNPNKKRFYFIKYTNLVV